MYSIKSIVACVFVFVGIVTGRPGNDVQIVESTIREVRAIAPDLFSAETNYNQNYGGDDEDSVGYLKRSEDGGSDGYKHFDSYHVKDGDKYGYEKHSAFGKANNYEDDAGSAKGGDEKSSYKVAEEVNEDADDEGENLESSEKLTDAENEEVDEHYTQGEAETEGGDDGAHYAEGAHYDFDDGESEKYTEADGESEAEDVDY